MINLYKESIGNIRLLHMVKADLSKEVLPTVIYFHGFNGEKDSSLTPAYKMAERGLRVILPDSKYHGDRRGDITDRELDLAFWEIILQNISELAVIKDYFVTKGMTDPDRIGVGGTSMGGITTYVALAEHSWIKTGAVLMGTPKITDYARELIDRFNKSHEQPLLEADVAGPLTMLQSFDLSVHPEKLQNRPLFIWHGKKDPVVPIHLSQEFYEQIKADYDKEDDLLFIQEEGREHHLSKRSMIGAAEWFSKHL